MTQKINLDPLYFIFEQHLFNYQDSDRKVFIFSIVEEYLTYLRKSQIAVPPGYEPYIKEELSHQVNRMLIKKIYGCYSLQEYTQTVPKFEKKKTKSRYQRIGAKSG